MDPSLDRRRWPRYRTLWRWHFYAGLFCVPLVLWLALTGSLYLFKPQIEAWLDRDYDHLPVRGPLAAPSAQVAAALAAVPGGTLNAYELPTARGQAARVLVAHDARLWRVYVDPRTLRVLGKVDENRRPMRVLFYLHGELLMGRAGSMLVELAACWGVAMLLTGLALWWPRHWRGAGGVLYPRLGRQGRLFWRDLHAVSGVWVSLFALFLIVSGLPWSQNWGGLLKQARELAAGHEVRQDWTVGRRQALAAQRREAEGQAHAMHAGMAMPGGAMAPPPADAYAQMDRLLPRAKSLALAPPALLSPPDHPGGRWKLRSEAGDRTQRVNLAFDADGAVVDRVDFAQRPLIDRMVGVGVAAHEGQLFGWPNQLLGLFTATGLSLVCVSAVLLWWRRRTPGHLGAPPPGERSRLALGAFALIVLLGVFLPLFGLSLLLVRAIEWLWLRRWPRAARFLGLARA
ncbi:PepSY domain-containing protein [Stenotrophomonas sp. HITSZ_GD]|uniref:PepSY-associated TM helix domain-containing protein n=1 Tax=Stenotrophomonas sp. HITSZ_GD TaxID=3037248 RepID=UPI00240CFBA5|nr:PepSY domain-containing protein [Stenotrophomonas sp. HITSZ_GD]MDG2525763.1 PepSY domain-containing protein [Stenotrophomonas sp. HITSZ_GD]